MRLQVFWLIVLAAVWGYAVAEKAEDVEDSEKDRGKTLIRQYGDARVSKFVSADQGLSFICCIEGWPDVIGRDIRVKIARISEPDGIGEDREFYHKQLALFLNNQLSDSQIELRNICRDDESFSIVADVKADGCFIAPLLIKQQLAVLGKNNNEAGKDFQAADRPPQAEKPQEQPPKQEKEQEAISKGFVSSKNSDIFHSRDCSSAKRIKPENAVNYGSCREAIEAGKRPCARCEPSEKSGEN
jgi:hypothetical protein